MRILHFFVPCLRKETFKLLMEDTFLVAARKKLRAAKESLKKLPSKLTKTNAQHLLHQFKQSKKAKLATTLGICAFGLYTFWPAPAAPKMATPEHQVTQKTSDKMYFGMNANNLCVDEYLIKSGETLSGILDNHGVASNKVEELVKACSEKFDLRAIRPGQMLAFAYEGADERPSKMVFRPDIYHYYTMEFKDSAIVTETIKPVKLVHKEASGVIESNLWNAMKTSGASDELADYLGDVLAWTVDFYHLYRGDEFKILYTEKQIDGQPVGVESIEAAYYKQLDIPYYVFKYDSEKYNNEYYDEEGRPARRAFLKAPVKYSRISSRFSRRRFHPVLKRNKAHLGTDFAAPRGTPVFATANGVVSRAGRTRGNGNFVKIKHNDTYSTQYLHFTRIAKGIRPGVAVKQGQTIGYVGSTGLATGPHVCYRFWKNGRQVDPLRQKLPSPPPMDKEDLPQYMVYMDSVKVILDKVPVSQPEKTPDVITASVKP